ncbi:HAD-like domain-containing protein [Xylariaceae sp. FL0016]|nr:HAD-like domain-containing protein [Xylariaceae sp. FL0016]
MKAFTPATCRTWHGRLTTGSAGLRPHPGSRRSLHAVIAASRSQPPVRGSAPGWASRGQKDAGYGRNGVSSVRTLITDEKTNSAGRQAPPFAFAFDIDGVLLHVAKPIPGAPEALRYLQQHHIPFILLTNGGGKHETERVADLSAKLGVPLSVDNFVQSHTPFQELAHGHNAAAWAASTGLPQGEKLEALKDQNILVTGSDAGKARAIAEAYGFRHVITPADILAAHPAIYPFDPLLEDLYAATARPLPSPAPRIAAIFVFNDPRDWALDIQLITDLLQSERGVLGTYSARNGEAWQGDGQPALYFSNHDLVWSASYHLPRLGQGAFQAAVAGVWHEITAGAAPLRRTTIGKPYELTYSYAERVLADYRARFLAPGTLETETKEKEGGLRRVYMVGDNPESDIRGANEYASPLGTAWESVLVRTGVWSEARGRPRHEPRVIIDDVKAAVEWALKKEGWE